MRRVEEIIADLPVKQTLGDLSRIVADLHYDSRQARPQDAFVAIRGSHHDGHHFIRELYTKGVRVFFVEEIPPVRDAVIVQVENTRRWLPFLARNFFGNVVSEMKVVGVTGTNGKTTVAYMLHSILRRAHWKPGLISTVEYILSDRRLPAERTTPESLDLHRMFYQMYHNGLKSVVMEVSSHALALHRTDGIPFLAAVFTNMGHDHLDFHGTLENYFQAKKKLFVDLHKNARAIINLDDPFARRIIDETEAELFTYSMHRSDATVSLHGSQLAADGMYLTLRVPSGLLSFTTGMIGRFNIYNVLAATATAIALGLQDEFISQGIEMLPTISGRCERYISPRGFRVYIDYAHTPEAMQRILEALMEFQPKQLIVVFGCGGDRDFEKRPQMGKIAEDYADWVIITNDNPRSEDPQKIIDQILSGIFDQSRVRVIPNRKQAILTALGMAGKKDIVLIAGKGHETYQEFADRRVHFDDHAVVSKFLGEKA